MKLGEYLEREDIGIEQFGKRIGRSRFSVSKLVKGRTRPTRETAQLIHAATNGEVTAADLYPLNDNEIPAADVAGRSAPGASPAVSSQVDLPAGVAKAPAGSFSGEAAHGE